MFLFAAAGGFAADDPCNPNPLIPSLQRTCWVDLSNGKQAPDGTQPQPSNGATESARDRFWMIYPSRPNGPGFQAAQREFLQALVTKDHFYLLFALQHELFGDAAKFANALAMAADPLGLDPATPRAFGDFPTFVDDGIRPFAFPLFIGWANSLRRAEGRDTPGQWAQPQILFEAIQDRSNWRRAYEDARNWAELLNSRQDISKLPAQLYLVNQMESGVALALARAKPKDLPEPKLASLELYKALVKAFGEHDVLTAAGAVLHTPKNSMGGLAKRADIAIGTYMPAPSPNPYLLFLTLLTDMSPHNYAVALCFDQNALLVSGDSVGALNTTDQWGKAATVYEQLKTRFGEKGVTDAAARLKEKPKDDRGGPRGDPESKGAIAWFTALLKDPKTPVPDVSQFLASSYDPRWMGKIVDVRGTVARVELDTSGSPRYATIHFKEAKNDRFTAYTPNSDILDSYGQNASGLVGKPIEIWGQVQDWREGSGVRFLTGKQLKVLDAGALAGFRESSPEWMKMPSGGATSVTDSPKYLAWKKFPVGAKASYESALLHEYKPGTNQYTKTKISNFTFTLESIDEERAVVRSETAISGKIAGRNGPDNTSSDQLIFKRRQLMGPSAPMDDPRQIVTWGEETLTINGKQISTRWECVTRADDPLTFTKTWTSAEVPGGLVRTQQQSHTQITGETYRNISQTLYAPIDGVDPQLGDGAVRTPPPAAGANPARPTAPATPAQPAQPAPPPVRPAPPAASPTPQQDLLTRYRALTVRASQDRLGLGQAERKLTLAGVALPDEIRAARDRLTIEQQAAASAIRTRDNAAAEQKMRDLEDTLAAIEKFIAK
jgi:hypothetical protein